MRGGLQQTIKLGCTYLNLHNEAIVNSIKWEKKLGNELSISTLN